MRDGVKHTFQLEAHIPYADQGGERPQHVVGPFANHVDPRIAHHPLERLLAKHQKEIVDRQYLLGRVSDAATEIYVSACVLNRLDHLIRHSHDDGRELSGHLETGRYYLRTARRRIKRSLADLWDNDDEQGTSLARKMLKK